MRDISRTTTDASFNRDRSQEKEHYRDTWGADVWKRDGHSTADCDITVQQQARILFIQNVLGAFGENEGITLKRKYTISSDVLSILDALYPALTEASVMGLYERSTILTAECQGIPVFIDIYQNEGGDASSRPTGLSVGRAKVARSKDIYEFQVLVTSNRQGCELVFDVLDKAFAQEHHSIVKWWYKGARGPETRIVRLPALKTELRSEFYPDLSDPKQFLQDYLDSEAAILLLAGPPGTGKTTLLRHLICDHKLTAHVIYDEDLMRNDTVFQNFLFEADGDILVIEDADTILASREAEGNKLMSRFLNVSDGLIKLPDKKVVFTTNISDFGRVDDALLRPGRCYGVVHTRTLNLPEAQAVAKVASLPVPTNKGEYTLAGLFNQHQGGAPVRRIGFSGR